MWSLAENVKQRNRTNKVSKITYQDIVSWKCFASASNEESIISSLECALLAYISAICFSIFNFVDVVGVNVMYISDKRSGRLPALDFSPFLK